MLHARAQDRFQMRVDLREQAAKAVGEPVGLGDQVVVEPDEHLQLGDGLVVGLDRAEGVRHRAGRVGDDECVAGVGLGLAGIQIGDPPHREPRQVGDVAVQSAGDGERQGPDRGWLVDDDEHSSVLGLQLGEHFAEVGFAVGQPPVEGFLPGWGEGGGVVFALADVQAEEDVDAADIDHAERPSVVLFTRPCHGADRHIHITKSLPTWGKAGGHAPHQRSVSASGAGAPPGHALDKGR
ncbi:hypothetical protein GCM10010329_84630 [Streptomyces spiroverticillatus]|uniref:Uncharacterized protein n=1 Tax=Streptomyces finlayi TaxID=67296 RepID=A0A919CGB6_9ACTN|nr:hypothetical protein GCM10010329_84630 [Streptomyces spiroverticillatus]GHD19366.1 hypothetical protein GCM10010334_82950 [Streptomyces finlayi]